MGFLAEDQVVEAGVNGADRHGIRTHLLYALAHVLDHVRVKDCVSVLEYGSVVAPVYLAA